MNIVAEEFGYCLIHAIEPLDLFFIPKELSPEVLPIEDFAYATGIEIHHKPSEERLKLLMPYVPGDQCV